MYHGKARMRLGVHTPVKNRTEEQEAGQSSTENDKGREEGPQGEERAGRGGGESGRGGGSREKAGNRQAGSVARGQGLMTYDAMAKQSGPTCEICFGH